MPKVRVRRKEAAHCMLGSARQTPQGMPGFVVLFLARRLKQLRSATFNHILLQIRCSLDYPAHNYEILQGNYVW